MTSENKFCCQTLSCKMGFAVKAVLRLISSRFTEEEVDLTIEQYFILNILDHEEGLILQDLADILDRDKSAVLRHLNCLEEKHFVARTTDPDDKRRKVLLVTKSGLEVLNKARTLAQKVNEELVSDLPEEKLEYFEHMVTSLYEKAIAEDIS